MEVLILNSSYEPLQIISLKKALKLIFKEKVEVIKSLEDKFYSTLTQTFQMPSVIRLHIQVKVARKTVPYTRKNILIRDKFTCQYCGVKNPKMTIDHIHSISRGGGHTWTNVVVACIKCNVTKSNKHLHETEFKLMSKPKEPTFLHNLKNKHSDRTDWQEFFFNDK